LHERSLDRFVEDLQTKETPNFSYQVVETMVQRGIPLELIGYVMSKSTSPRLKYLVTTEIIASAFKKILCARLEQATDPIPVIVLYLK
jgi:hypothetical protein